MRRLLPATIGAILIIISYQALAHGYYSPAATCCAVLAATTAAISLRRGAHSPALVAIPSLIAIIAMMIFAAAVTQPATMFTVYMAVLSALMVAGSAILITLTKISGGCPGLQAGEESGFPRSGAGTDGSPPGEPASPAAVPSAVSNR